MLPHPPNPSILSRAPLPRCWKFIRAGIGGRSSQQPATGNASQGAVERRFRAAVGGADAGLGDMHGTHTTRTPATRETRSAELCGVKGVSKQEWDMYVRWNKPGGSQFDSMRCGGGRGGAGSGGGEEREDHHAVKYMAGVYLHMYTYLPTCQTRRWAARSTRGRHTYTHTRHAAYMHMVRDAGPVRSRKGTGRV